MKSLFSRTFVNLLFATKTKSLKFGNLNLLKRFPCFQYQSILQSTWNFSSFSTTVTNMSNKTALVIIANGSEETEAVSAIDTLRRAGVIVTVAGLVDSQPVLCSRNVTVVPDVAFPNCKGNSYDAILLPGGLKGSEAFANSAELGEVLKLQESNGGLIAAICAAPTALKAHKIGIGKALTSYPSVRDTMTDGNLYQYKEDRVVADGNLITSRGPGTAIEWALAISAYLVGKDKAVEVGKGMLAVGITDAT